MFCESILFPQSPEVLNSFSSMIICLVATNAIKNLNQDDNEYTVSITFLLNGIFSFALHVFRLPYFRILDEFSMILINAMVMRIVSNYLYPTTRNFYIAWTMLAFYFFIINPIQNFLFTFTVMLFISIVCALNLLFQYNEPFIVYAVLWFVSGTCCWVLAEMFCSVTTFWLHAVFHVNCSMGLYLLLAGLSRIRQRSRGDLIEDRYDFFGFPITYLS